MEPKQIFKATSNTPVKLQKDTPEPEKQMTIIVSPKPHVEKSDNVPNKVIFHENKERKILDQKLAPKHMDGCVKLLDENFEFNNAAIECLDDASTNYLVVAVIGMQGVGKSMVLNLIAQPEPDPDICEKLINALHTMDASDNENEIDEINNTEQSAQFKRHSDDNFKFKMQTFDHLISNRGCTKGIDMYVTENRVILLDCQALWSLTEDEGTPPPFRNTDPLVGGLQVASFLMSISHLIIAVSDWFTDDVLIKYLQSADMLRPSLTASAHSSAHASAPAAATEGEEAEVFTENHPHLLIVCTNCNTNKFTASVIKPIQQMCRMALKKTKLRFESGMYMHSTKTKNTADDCCMSMDAKQESRNKPINMFMLPEIPETKPDPRSRFSEYSFEQVSTSLRAAVLSASRHQLTNVPCLSERGWLHYANKAWDTVTNCTFFMEYEALLP